MISREIVRGAKIAQEHLEPEEGRKNQSKGAALLDRHPPHFPAALSRCSLRPSALR